MTTASASSADRSAHGRSALAPAGRRRCKVPRSPCRKLPSTNCVSKKRSSAPARGRPRVTAAPLRPKRAGRASPPRAPTMHRTQSPSPRTARPRRAGRAASPTPAARPSPAHPALRVEATCCRRATSPDNRPRKTTIAEMASSDQNSGSPNLAKLKRRRMTFEKRAEPRPRRRSNYAQRDGEEGQDRERHGHHRRALMRMARGRAICRRRRSRPGASCRTPSAARRRRAYKTARCWRRQCCAASRMASLLQKPEKNSGKPHSASMPMA